MLPLDLRLLDEVLDLGASYAEYCFLGERLQTHE